jgi:hypothetical protein
LTISNPYKILDLSYKDVSAVFKYLGLSSGFIILPVKATIFPKLSEIGKIILFLKNENISQLFHLFTNQVFSKSSSLNHLNFNVSIKE